MNIDCPSQSPCLDGTAAPFDLAAAQRALLDTGSPVLRTEDLPLSRAVGRVLAEALGDLPAGTRLQTRHVPHLASAGRPTVRVFQKLKVGVLTLGEAGEPRQAESGLAGPMVASLLDGLGTVAIAAPRVIGDDQAVRSVLDMLLSECRLVLVGGCTSQARREMLHEVLHSRGGSHVDWALCDGLGAHLSVATLGSRSVVCLPCGLAEAFMAFVLLVSPLVRRLQGRADPLPPGQHARVHLPTTGGTQARYLWARETGHRAELAVDGHAPSGAPDAIAQSDGIARRLASTGPADGSLEVLYHPFSTWLQ